MLPSGVTNIAYEERRRLSADAKEAIGQAAAALIPAGEASLFPQHRHHDRGGAPAR